jgi:PIN domain nuclease of toxin-antitoxin system
MGGELVILLDTHMWVWRVNEAKELRPHHRELIDHHLVTGLGVSVICCWEVAKLAEKRRLKLDRSVGTLITEALQLPGVLLLPLTPEIAVEACQLPGEFHRDPADELIVATSRILKIPLLTADAKILGYPHVTLLS